MTTKINTILFIVLFVFNNLQAQEKLVKVIEEQKGNRIAFYAINEDEQPYDVLFEVKGSDFRQSAARPRLTRVPATSKVHIKTIILYRDKTPKYTHTLQVNDSLSRRALKKEYTIIEVPPKMITPKRHITIYRTSSCLSCDTIISKLNENRYIFKLIDLQEKKEVKEALSKTLGKSLDSIAYPIINLGGHIYTWITDYETLLSEMDK
ncbi:hypothetical protein FGF1_41080 [Flavobacteriaceae bacterium GF1]